jgi:sigma-B regulation protein RsbU (phosphoserine phosphatase)
VTALFRMCAADARLEHLLELYKGLVEVSALINGITASDELLPEILEVARRVLHVEAASLFMLNDHDALELVISRGYGAATLEATPRITVPRGKGIAGWVIANRQPLLVADAYADPRFYREADAQTGFRTRSLLCVPLLGGEKEIGVLQVLNPVGREAFDEHDLEVFTAYGNLAATAIEKLRTLERQRIQERRMQEFAFAHEIQESFLPQTLPRFANLSFAAAYRPAETVGGDFYDVLVLSPDEVYFVIGDVSGKGVPAALLMAQALSILRLIVKPGVTPAGAMMRWNEMITGRTIRGMFITALVGRMICSTRTVEFCSAGHCHPMRVQADGTVRDVTIPGSPPLGLLPQLSGSAHTVQLAPCEWFVLFTDGLTESFDADRIALDRDGVHSLLARRFENASDVVAALQAGESQHRGNSVPHDDLTVLVCGFQ